MPGRIINSLINFYDSYEKQLQTVRENIVSLESLLREMGRNRVHPKVMQESFAYYRLWKKALQILLETHQKFNGVPNDLRPIFLRNPPIPPPQLHTGCAVPASPYGYRYVPPEKLRHLTKKPKR